MPAMVENMAYLGQKPWHGLGYEVPEEKKYDLNFFQENSGTNFKVEVSPIFTRIGNLDIPVESHKVFIRTDTKAVLGLVGHNTNALQPHEVFDFFKPYLEGQQAELHTAGSLDEGRIVWVLAKITGKNLEIVPGDTVDKFLLLSSSYKMGLGVRVGYTPIRVVCMNTLRMAHNADASKLIRIRRTSNMRPNLKAVQDTMNLVNQEFEATASQYRKLANKGINQDDLRKYLKLVFEVDEDASTRTTNILGQIFLTSEVGLGTNIPGVKGTLWGAYNAVTEYLTYIQGRTHENRLNNMWFGTNQNVSERALEIALEMAG